MPVCNWIWQEGLKIEDWSKNWTRWRRKPFWSVGKSVTKGYWKWNVERSDLCFSALYLYKFWSVSSFVNVVAKWCWFEPGDLIFIPMLNLNTHSCSLFILSIQFCQESISWIPKKASNKFEAFEAVFMELWTWTRCHLLCHK